MQHNTRTDLREVCQLRSLADALSQLTDQRKKRGIRYELGPLLILMVMAKLSGEDTPSAMADWVALRAEGLKKALGLEWRRMPHQSTYRRLLQHGLEMNELEQMAGEFLGALQSEAALLNLDGKTLRGTIPGGQTKGAHLLSLYQAETGLVLGQSSVARKENEISAAPRLLKKVNLQGKIVSGDAMLAQRKLSRRIVKAGGDFLWTIKDNQPLTHRAIADLFTAERAGSGPRTHDFCTAQEWDKGHGRIERRRLTTSSLLNGYLKWPCLGQVFELEREITDCRTQQTRSEKVCGLTSLPATKADPARLLQLTRGHWSIENGLHYRRDVTFGEDRCRMKSHTAAEALAVINNLTLGLIRHAGWSNVAEARRYYAAQLGAALQLIILAPD